jgi:hypothetical protein
VFRVPRSLWIDAIRGDLQSNDPAVARPLDAPEAVRPDDDLDDPVPVIRLLNRQRAGRAIDPEEAYEVMAAMESVVLGDVDTCRAKLERYREIGVDRLMCLMQFGALPHARVMQSLRLTGEHLVHAF